MPAGCRPIRPITKPASSVRAMEPTCRACLVYDESLTAYDFGPAHPMNPIRVDLTVALADGLGVLDHLPRVPAPDATEDDLATVHEPALIEAVMAAGADPTLHDLSRGLGTRRRPHVPAHARGLPPRRRREHRGRAPGVDRRGRPRGQHRRRPAPRDARPGERLLRLQRRGRGDPVAARQRRRAGGLRRRRRPPRRRRRGDLLRRPAGAHDLPARDRPDALPRHRLPGRRRAAQMRWARRSTSRCPRAPPTPAGCGPSTRWCRRWSGSSLRTCWSPSRAATATATTRWPTSRSASTDSGRATSRCTTWPTRRLTGAGWRSAAVVTPSSRSSRARGPTCSSVVSGRPLGVDLATPEGWRGEVSGRLGVRAPSRMTDGRTPAFQDWSEGYDPDTWLDRAVQATRDSVFPWNGLDPQM